MEDLEGLEDLEDAVASAGKLSMGHNSVGCNAFSQYIQDDIFEIIKNIQIYQSDRQKKIYYLLYWIILNYIIQFLFKKTKNVKNNYVSRYTNINKVKN